MIVIPQCCRCKHFHWDRQFTCEAFPQGIPRVVLLNRRDHKLPVGGDGGIRFEEDPAPTMGQRRANAEARRAPGEQQED